jgi:hypothetical protein
MEPEHSLTRQMRLTEVGPRGQARIASATLEVSGRDGSLIEFLYLHRAGVERLTLRPDREAPAFAHGPLFRHGGAESFASGAWRALGQIRKLLQVTEGPS